MYGWERATNPYGHDRFSETMDYWFYNLDRLVPEVPWTGYSRSPQQAMEEWNKDRNAKEGLK